MQTSELIQSLGADSLNRLAASLKVTRGKQIKQHDQFAALIGQALQELPFGKRVEMLTKEQYAALEYLSCYCIPGEKSMDRASVVRQLQKFNGAKGQAESWLRILQDAAAVFVVRDYYREIVVVPDDIWVPVVKQLAERIVKAASLRSAPADAIQLTGNNGLAVYHDLLTVLSAMARDPVDVSQQGFIYKRTSAKISEKFRSSEALFLPAAGDDKAGRFHFFETFIRKFHIAKFAAVANLDLHAVQSLLSVPYVEWAALLHQHYLSNMWFFQHSMPVSFLHSVVFRLGRTGWVEEQVVFDFLTETFRLWGLDAKPDILRKYTLDPFLLLGLMQNGTDANGHRYWRWTPLGLEYTRRNLRNPLSADEQPDDELSDQIFVQPNLEILVPENVLPAIRWFIEAIADLKQADTVFVYELSRKRVLQALESDLSLDNIKELLTKFSQIPIAPNIWKTLEGWTANLGKARLWDVMILQIEDPSLAERMAKEKKLASYLAAALSPEVFVIKREDEARVRDIMTRLGYPVPLQVKRMDSVGNQEKNRRPSFHQPDKSELQEKVRLHHLSAFDLEFMEVGLEKELVVKHRLELDYAGRLDDFDEDGDYVDDEDYDDDEDEDYFDEDDLF